MSSHQPPIERGLTQESVFRGKLLRVRVDTVALPDGRTAQREVVEHPGAVAVLALTAAGEVLLVRQYRYAVGASSLEIPAGCLDRPGEAVEEAARRELREEAGQEAARWLYLGAFHPSPGILGETMHLLLAEGLTACPPAPEEDEFLEIVAMPVEAALEAVLTGAIRDAKTVIALLWWRQFGRQSRQSPPEPPSVTLGGA